jgi:hypothetical protein
VVVKKVAVVTAVPQHLAKQRLLHNVQHLRLLRAVLTTWMTTFRSNSVTAN